MKKTIAIFFLCCSLSLFAETGYRGYKWYSNIWDFPASGQIEEAKEVGIGYNAPLVYEKKIMDEQTFLFYDFDTRTMELQAAGYLIPKNKTTELKTKIKEQKREEFKIALNEIISEYEIDEQDIVEYGEMLIKILAEYSTISECENIAKYMEIEREELEQHKDEKATGTITIYDYNDDTRIYLFEGAVKEKTVVVYVPHEQDY